MIPHLNKSHLTTNSKWLYILVFILFKSSQLHGQEIKTFALRDINYDPMVPSFILDFKPNPFDYDNTYSISSISPDYLELDEPLEPIGAGKYQFKMLDNFKPDTYTFKVQKDGKLNHLVTVKIKPPKPRIGIEIIQGEHSKGDTLSIDYRTPLEATLRISGGPFFDTPEVELQGKKLETRKVSLNEVESKLNLRGTNLSDLRLGNQKIKITHADWGSVENEIYISGKKPLISSTQPIEYTTKVPQQVPLKVTGANISPNGLICVECIPNTNCYVEENCFSIIDYKMTGTVESAPMGMSLPQNVNSTSFRVYIKNGDGSVSSPAKIDIVPSDATATLTTAAIDEPLIVGTPTDIVINSTANNFPLSTVSDYRLTLNGEEDPVDFQINTGSSTFKQLRGTITIPENKYGSKISFKLLKDGNHWAGTIEKIHAYPKPISDETIFRKNQSYSIGYTSVIKGISLTTNSPGIELSDSDISDGIGKLNITNAAGSSFILVVSLNGKDKPLRIDTFKIEPWVHPKGTFSVSNESLKYNDQTIIKLNHGENLKIVPKEEFVSPNNPQQLSVQLYGKAGNAIGTAHTLSFTDHKELSIHPIGLSSGDEFRVELKTIDDQREVFIGYIKRPFWHRWNISAGISGVRYELSDDNNESTSRYAILGGITTGAFYLFETKRPQPTRFIGAGVYGNFIENNQANDLKATLGVGLLLAEKLLVGYDLSKRGAITVGANINILDFAKLLGSKTVSE